MCAKIKAKEVIGIEINPVARAYAIKNGVKCVAATRDLPEDFADLIVSNSVLEHVENPLGELRDLRSRLKDAGKIVFRVPNESCETEYVRSNIDNHLFTWNALNIGNLFKAAGFFVNSVQRIQEQWPKNFYAIRKEVSFELFDSLCDINGKASASNSLLIVASK